MKILSTQLKSQAVKIAESIEAFSEWSGRATSWLVLLLALIIGYDVGMRYLFQAGSVALQELEWHLFALIFLFGAAYTLKYNEHVRVDVLYQSPRLMNPRRRAWVDLLGTLLFLIPFCLLVITGSFPFVEGAWNTNEGSPDPGGLPARWLLKAAIPVGFTMLLLQGVAMVIRSAQSLLCHSYEYQPSGNNPPDDQSRGKQSRGDQQESQH